MTRRAITIDDSLRGQQVTVRRDITATRPTREHTGHHVWTGVITEATRDAATGELAALEVRTPDEWTWLALGTWDTGARHWSTVAELHPA
jgi:hypothetical protein